MVKNKSNFVRGLLYFNKFSKSWAFQTLNNFLIKIQDSLSIEFLRGVFTESKGKERKEELLPPLLSALDRC